MELTQRKAASLIDISAVRTHHSLKDIEELAELAKRYRFINVHVLPSWVATMAEHIQGVEGVYVGAPVGFPSGGAKTVTKVVEAQQLLEDGVQEMDIVMNVGRFKNHEDDMVLEELKTIIGLTNHRIPTKVIIEINVLTDEEVQRACDLVMESGADYVKTGTGWVPGKLDLDRIRMMKDYCGDQIKLKVAGGIRTKEDFLTLCEMGVERMGINVQSAIEIVESLPK